MSVHRLKVTLADSDPPIWRRLEVPSEFSLEELAQVLLAAFGWEGSHLHQFEQGRTTWAPRHEEDEWYESAIPVIDTSRVRLREMRKSRKPLLFVYDLGDCWKHVLEIEGVDPSNTATVARCLAGERSAPPEDCGGVSGYARLLEILEDPKHPEYGEMEEWVGPHFQPERIDVGEINEVLAMLRTAPEIEAPRAAAKIGRNDPCPCGSGKKYKKCHLGSEAGTARTALQIAAEFHALDKEMFEKVAGWAKHRYPAHEWAAAGAAAYGQAADEEAELVAQWMLFHAETPAGMSITDEYLQAHREKNLLAVEEAWCESQGLAWLSAWEVLDVEVGRSLGLRDLLTGEERVVAEKTGSESMKAGYAILGRVVDTDGISVLAGMHGYGAMPMDVAAFVKEVRRSLGKKKLAPHDLRSQDATLTLLRRWRKIFSDRANAPLPAMTNTSGEPLLMTTDHFALVRAEPAEIRRRLEILPGAEKGKPNEIVFVDNDVVVAVVTLKAKTLEIVTNSTARADVWRNRVELVGKEFVRFRVRETSDPAALVEQNRKSGAKPLPREEHAEDPEIDARVREIKAKHYRQWLDEKIPALGGETPRAAAKGKRRGDLETLLKEMEVLEAQLPPSQRADLRFLREELGFDATGKPPKRPRAPRT